MSITIEPMLTTLAQTSTTQILIWVMAMIVLVIAGGIVAAWVRKRYHEEGPAGAPIESLSLHTLRQMHAQGGLSDEEFETLKGAAVRTYDAPPKPAPENSGVRAKPGFDLAGDPLPGPSESGDQDDGEDHPGPGA